MSTECRSPAAESSGDDGALIRILNERFLCFLLCVLLRLVVFPRWNHWIILLPRSELSAGLFLFRQMINSLKSINWNQSWYGFNIPDVLKHPIPNFRHIQVVWSYFWTIINETMTNILDVYWWFWWWHSSKCIVCRLHAVLWLFYFCIFMMESTLNRLVAEKVLHKSNFFFFPGSPSLQRSITVRQNVRSVLLPRLLLIVAGSLMNCANTPALSWVTYNNLASRYGPHRHTANRALDIETRRFQQCSEQPPKCWDVFWLRRPPTLFDHPTQ